MGIVIALLATGLVVAAPTVLAGPGGSPTPADLLTVTVLLDKASYLSGDNATATAVVYRTPAPANYTYTWRVENAFGVALATLVNGTSTYTYAIPLDFQGLLRFRATVDDDTGLTSVGTRTANVAAAYVALSLDRSEYNPGDHINAYFSVASHVLTNPTWTYTVTDAQGTIVLTGTTNNTYVSFDVPNPSSRSYTFAVTASGNGRTAQAQLSIPQASGYVLSISVDKTSYAPGDTVRIHLSLTARGTASLPSSFRFTGGLFPGVASATALSTSPSADLYVALPAGVGQGDLLLAAFESNTGASAYETIHVGGAPSFWSTEVGGFPAIAIVLAFLVVILLIALISMWRRSGGGMFRSPRGPPGPPPAEGPVRAPPTSPMTIACRHCGKPIDITTSKRPIEVMCPSCGETQLVT